MALAFCDPPETGEGDEAEWERRAASIDRKHMEVLSDQWKLMRERLHEQSQVLQTLKRSVHDLKVADSEKQEALAAERCAREAAVGALQEQVRDIMSQLAGERVSRQRQLDVLLDARDASMQKLREQVLRMEEGMASLEESLADEKQAHSTDMAALQEGIMFEALARKGHMKEVSDLIGAESGKTQHVLQEQHKLLERCGKELSDSLANMRLDLEEVLKTEKQDWQRQFASARGSLEEEVLNQLDSVVADMSQKHDALHNSIKEEILEEKGRNDRGLHSLQQSMSKMEQRVDVDIMQDLRERRADAEQLRGLLLDQRAAMDSQVAALEEACETLSTSLVELRAALDEEQKGTWEADVQDLRGQVDAERLAREGHICSVKEMVVQERRAREAHLASLDERLVMETEARRAHAEEFEGLLGGEREARERLRETFQVSVSNSLASQRAAVREDVDRLQKFVAEAGSEHATRQADLKDSLLSDMERQRQETEGVRDVMGKLEKKLDQELLRLKDVREQGAAGLQEALKEERSVREGHVNLLKERLQRMEGEILEERNDRERGLRSAQEALARESSAREVMATGLQEAVVGEARAREAQLLSVHDLLTSEASMREADAAELRAELAGDRGVRHRLQSDVQDVIEGKLQEHAATAAELQKRLADSVESCTALRRAAEEGFSGEASKREQQFAALVGRLGDLEKRLSEEWSSSARELREQLSKQVSAHESHATAVSGLLEAEKEARELELGSLRSSMLEESGRRQASIEEDLSKERAKLAEHAKKLLEAVEAVDAKVHGIVDQERKVRNSSISELQDCLGKLEAAVRECAERERSARVAGLRELQEQLGGEQKSRESLAGGLREQLERERRALGAQLASLGDRLAVESEARRVESEEVGERLSAERAAREREHEEARNAGEARFQDLRSSLQDRLARVDRRLEELAAAHASSCSDLKESLASEAGHREQGLCSLQEALGDLDRKVSEGLRTELSSHSERLSEVVARLKHEQAAQHGRVGALEDAVGKLEGNLGQEQLARQGDAHALHELLTAERSAREDQILSLQAVQGKDRATHEVQLASVQELLAEEIAARQLDVSAAKGSLSELQSQEERLKGDLQDRLNALDERLVECRQQHGVMKDSVFGERGLQQQLSSVLSDDLAKMENMLLQAIQKDEEARERDALALRDLVSAEALAREGSFSALQGALEQDKKVQEARTEAMQELFSGKLEACKVQLKELEGHVCEQKTAREKELGVCNERLSEKVKHQDSLQESLQRRVAGLETRLADTCAQHASRHADLKEDILGECRSREQDLQVLRGALQSMRHELEGLIEEEGKEREANLLQVQEQLREERSAREEQNADTRDEHEKQADAMLEMITRDLDARETRLREVEARLVGEQERREESCNLMRATLTATIDQQHVELQASNRVLASWRERLDKLESELTQEQEARLVDAKKLQDILVKEVSAREIQVGQAQAKREEDLGALKEQMRLVQFTVDEQWQERARAVQAELAGLKRFVEEAVHEASVRHSVSQSAMHDGLSAGLEEQGRGISSLFASLHSLSSKLEEERAARMTEVSELHSQLSRDSKARERYLTSVRELLAREKQAQELHLNSMQEFILGKEMPQRQESGLSDVSAFSERQDGSFRERIDGLRRLISESIERHSSTCAAVQEELCDERGQREQHVAALVERLERLEIRLEDELHRRQALPPRELDSTTASTEASKQAEMVTMEPISLSLDESLGRDHAATTSSGLSDSDAHAFLLHVDSRICNMEAQLRDLGASLQVGDEQHLAGLQQRLAGLEERLEQDVKTEQGSLLKLQELLGTEKCQWQAQARLLQELISQEREARAAHLQGLQDSLASSQEGHRGSIMQSIEALRAQVKGQDQYVARCWEQCEAFVKEAQAVLAAQGNASVEAHVAAMNEGLRRLEKSLEDSLKAEQEARRLEIGTLKVALSGEREERECSVRSLKEARDAELAKLRKLMGTEMASEPKARANKAEEEEKKSDFQLEGGGIKEGMNRFEQRLEEAGPMAGYFQKELATLRERLDQQGGAVQALLAKEHDAREEHCRALLEFLEGLLNTGGSAQERAGEPCADGDAARPSATEALGRRQLDAIRASIQSKLREQHASIEDRVTYLEKLLNESVSRCASMQATIRDLYGERGQHESCVTNLMEHLRKLEGKLEQEIRKAHDNWEADVYELQELVGVEILRSRGGRALQGPRSSAGTP